MPAKSADIQPFIAAGQALNIISFDPPAHDAEAEAADDRSLNLALRRRRVRSEVLRIALDADATTIEFLTDVIAALSGRRLVLFIRGAVPSAPMLELMKRLCELGAATCVVVAGLQFEFTHERAAVYHIADDSRESIESLADALMLTASG